MEDEFYCQVCQRGDPRGRKHIYTKKHKERLNAVLRKFEAKMQPAKNCTLTGPTVLKFDPSEVVEKFWCPFCSAEVVKHERHEQFIIQFKSWAEHLCSVEHHKRVHSFFWTNKLDMKRRDRYKLNQEKLELLQSHTNINLDKVREDTQKSVQEEASRIREVEKRRLTLQTVSSQPQSEAEPEIPSIDPGLGPMGHQGGTIPAGLKYRGDSRSNLSNTQTVTMVGNLPSLSSVKRSTELDGGNHLFKTQGHLQLLPVVSPHVPSATPASSGPAFPSYHPERRVSGAGTDHVVLDTSLPGPSNSSFTPTTRRQISSRAHADQSSKDVGSSLRGSRKSEVDPLLLKVKTSRVISSGGLTVISRKKSGLKGNIHSGSVPPWLLQDDDAERRDQPKIIGPTERRDQPKVIGPTAEDYQRYLESEKKRKLNPKRVGANFDHHSETSDEWLPSFGRVWNHGPRWRSRKQYRKEAGSELKKGR